MSKKTNSRKKAVINPRVQWTLASRVVLHFFVFVCAGAIFGIINQFLINPFGGVSGNMGTFARNSAPVFVALICLLPIFVRDTLTLSNRIAGPMYNLENTVKRLADGESDVPKLKFREGDMWSELPDEFNRMVDTLNASAKRQNEESASGSEQQPSEPACV